MYEPKQPWWRATARELCDELNARVKLLELTTNDAREDGLLFINVATNFNPSGQGAYGALYSFSGAKKVRRNLCAAGINLAASLVTASRTLPSYQTSGADWKTRRISEERARVIHAQMIQLGAFSLGDQAFADSALCGTGVTMGIVDPETGRPKLVRALPNSVLVDASEGRDPRSLYWIHFIPRETLREHYAKRDLADSAGPSESDWSTYCLTRADKTADLVRIVEAWHLPVGERAGRHVIAASNTVIADEEWTSPRFPAAVMRYEDRPFGWYGQGLVERLMPAQLRISELQKVLDRCQDLGSNAVYLVEQNSNVSVDRISNMPGQVYTYQGTAPQLVTWSGTLTDIAQQIDQTWAQALEQQGLNPAMAAGGLPQKSLNSGRAVRAADDVVTRSMLTCIRRLEFYYLQVAQLIVDLNDMVVGTDPAYQVTGYSTSGRIQFLRTSKWAELGLDDCDARLTVLPMSALPSTLQARLATITELISEGYVSRAQAVALQEMPDVDAWQDSETAQDDLIQHQIDNMLDGNPELPVPYQDYALAVDQVTRSYLIQYRTGAPPETLDLFKAYLAYAQGELDKLAAAKAPAPTNDLAPAALNDEAAAAVQATQAGAIA